MLGNMCKLDKAVHKFGYHRIKLQMPADIACCAFNRPIIVASFDDRLCSWNECWLIACTAVTGVPERCKLGNSSMVSK